ncbi:response regulator [Paenibacillus tepidiphilus]|uniref:response regulator n=1 Tax=Paenibacillus tepidiphilus TaxID=2608683 RepID=UPI00123BB21F|nr:response regulator [Paenibacillus tepidiphilus]
MKKVMLVDDEILIRESIRECVDWEKEGFIYCGDAPDGELALPIISEQLPDILITDIKMPFINGLELSSVVRQKFPKIKIIILSGHDDFQYAQTALRLGVEDYCLKPFSASDLLQLLHQVSRRMDEEQRLKQKSAYTPEKLFADLCGGLISPAAAIESAEQLGLPLAAAYYAVAILAWSPSSKEEHAELQPQIPADLMSGLLEEIPGSLTFKRSRNEIVLICKGNDPEQISSELEAITDELKQKLQAAYECELTVGLGAAQERLQGIHLSYLEAENDRMFKQMSRQNAAALLDASFDPSTDCVPLDRGRLVQFLKLGDARQATEFLLQFAPGLGALNWKSIYAYYLLNDITLELVQTAKSSFRTAANPADLVKELQQQIRNIASTDECLVYLNRLFERLWEWRSEGSDKYRELINKVRHYIREHYDNEQLSLSGISRQVGVSSSHLSKIFSQETGQTITEFLTATRIGKAKELLKTTGHKTFEIAFSVGYNDQHYFSNLFKKVTGMTPMEYRKHGASEDELHFTRKGAGDW